MSATIAGAGGGEKELVAREIASAASSNRIASTDHRPDLQIKESLNGGFGGGDGLKKEKPGWMRFLAYVGPGFLVSLAYLDPGNLEADLQAGANHKYELLWVILIGLIFALIIQSLAANLGVATGRHLAELCRSEYPAFISICLWLLSEVAVISADIPEVIGTAFALNILFGIPVWSGVLFTGCSTLLLLGLQKFGIRKLEFLVTSLVFLLAACYFAELAYVKPPASEVVEGLFVPKLSGNNAVADSIAIIGALIMPHNLFLHSALVLSRKVKASSKGINEACKYFLWETGLALFVSLLINIAVVSVTGGICSRTDLSEDDSNRCGNITLDSANFLLRDVLGKSSKVVYAIALLASGQSSAITGTYSGQFVMQGFLDIRMKTWQRNLMTRTIAIVPSLMVSIIGGSAASGELIIISQMILSFELPFALLPLLKFSSSKKKLGPHINSIYTIAVAWIIGACIIGINVYYLSTGFVGWLVHSKLHTISKAFVGIIVFPIMATYLLSTLYLAIRKDHVETFIKPLELASNTHVIKMEDGELRQIDIHDGGGGHDVDFVPFREDLADIIN